MGCDIHLWAERRNRDKYDPEVYDPLGENDEAPWVKIDDPVRSCWSCKGTGKTTHHWLDGPELECALAVGGTATEEASNGRTQVLLASPAWCSFCDGKGRVAERFYRGRNYGTFAILADVRNSRRVFGAGGEFDPIAEPRGVPRDASDFYIAEQWRWGVDGHSHSWFTIQELLDFPWAEKTTRRNGVVTVGDRAWKNWRATNSPWRYPDDATDEERAAFCSVAGDISGEKVSVDTALANERAFDGRPVAIDWNETYEATAEEFLRVVREEIAPLGDPTETRIVFFFDN